MKPLKSNMFVKVLLIILIGLLLLIPAAMIRGIISERKTTKMMAETEVSSKWADQQTISGPVLSIPYTKFERRYTASGDTAGKLIAVKEYLHILPSELYVKGELLPEKRKRGIYEVIVYTTKLHISGDFKSPQSVTYEVPAQSLMYSEALLTIGISDLRGIEKQIELNWNNKKSDFEPGVITSDVLQSGIHTSVSMLSSDTLNYTFSLELELKGSYKLYFTPLGQTTDISLSSSWDNPSFNGAFLPDSHTISPSGFAANWNILHLNRNYPQSWSGSKYSIADSAFGVDLIMPVDVYQKATRTVKYAILFIAFSFIVFFFVEVMNKKFMHPIQYVLVGFALVIFFTLLLSIAEYLNFNLAFCISAISTLLLIGFYVKTIFKSHIVALLISGILFVLYTFIFIIIQLQDYALLIGSIGVFLVLALMMYFSRKVDWYNLKIEE